MARVSDHKSLDCPVCFEIYISPRVLPCSHTLCEKCIDAHVRSQVGNGTECLCPLCNSSIVPPNPKLSKDKWAKSFPLNSLMCFLLESAEMSDDGENTCEPCKTDGKITTADVWCTDCRERLCHSCDKSHRRYKQHKHHSTIPIAEMEEDTQSNIPFDQNCDIHSSKEIEVFCSDHRKLCCYVCVSTDHRQCSDVRSIDDIARKEAQRSKSAYPGIISDINEIKTEMEKIMSSKAKNETEISQEKEEIIQDVDGRIDAIITELNKLRNQFRNETNQLHKEKESSILEKKKMVKSFMTNLDNSEEILQIVEKKGSSRQKFATFENVTTQITSHYRQLKSRFTEDKDVHLRMESSKVLDAIEGAIKSLDTVEVSTNPCTRTNAVLENTDRIIRKANFRTDISTECAAQVQKRDLMTSPVTFVKAVNRQTIGATTRVTGVTLGSDGLLLMADYNNQRLLQLDNEYNVVKEYKIDGRPTDVAVGNNDNEIYIAVNQQHIYKCTLDTGLTIVSRIEAPSGTWGITVSGDNLIVGTKTAVVTLKQDGSVVQSIPRSGTYANSCVATSKSQQTICHTDKHDVVCRKFDGKELFRYQNQQLKDPIGVHTDEQDNLYICGFNSHNVHQVSLNRQSSRIIVDKLHSISQPYSVMFHPQRDELIVTSVNEDTVFEIYRLGPITINS